MRTDNFISKPKKLTQSSLLISEKLIKKYPLIRNLKGKVLTELLHSFINNNEMRKKIHTLRAKKWKKTYQPEGLNLRKIYFYPYEDDWAELSLMSNGTGFSRCYIFVFLLKIKLGIISPDADAGRRNSPATAPEKLKPDSTGCITLYKEHDLLKRTLFHEFII